MRRWLVALLLALAPGLAHAQFVAPAAVNGGIYLLSPGTLADQQKQAFLLDSSGNLKIDCVTGCSSAAGTGANNADGVAAVATGLGQTTAYPFLWNGATFDRWYGDKTDGAWVNVKTSAAIAIAGTPTVLQGTSPWVVSVSGTPTVLQGTSPWVTSISGTPTVLQGTSPWVVSISGTPTVLQGSAPWTMNPGTPGAWALGATGAAVPATAHYIGANALSAETKGTAGNLTGPWLDLTGKAVTSPYAARETMVRGAVSGTGIAALNLIAAGATGIKTYVTDLECARSDTGTTAILATLNDSASTVLVLPNSGGGGGNNKTFEVPLATAAAATLTVTPSSSVTTFYCAAQGFQGY